MAGATLHDFKKGKEKKKAEVIIELKYNKKSSIILTLETNSGLTQ